MLINIFEFINSYGIAVVFDVLISSKFFFLEFLKFYAGLFDINIYANFIYSRSFEDFSPPVFENNSIFVIKFY
jgi:hypothetical protein